MCRTVGLRASVGSTKHSGINELVEDSRGEASIARPSRRVMSWPSLEETGRCGYLFATAGHSTRRRGARRDTIARSAVWESLRFPVGRRGGVAEWDISAMSATVRAQARPWIGPRLPPRGAPARGPSTGKEQCRWTMFLAGTR
jgi:hypothetical protein